MTRCVRSTSSSATTSTPPRGSLFAAIDGLMLQQLIFEDPERTREAIALLQRLLGELQERD